MNPEGPSVHFLNVEYFFRLLYDLLHGTGAIDGQLTLGGLLAQLSHLWLFITILSFLFSLAAIGVFVYSTMRILQVRALEAPKYHTTSHVVEHAEVERSRWQYILELMESLQESDWRQAIIEADIMLDETLTRVGYQGATVADKLKGANPAHFHTLDMAWDAHKTRNEIAHQGSTFHLTESVARRCIANFEAVFREFNEI